MIAVSTVGTGDPDLFINHGDAKLPTKDSYDFKASTSRSEIATIILKDTYFLKNNITSMKSPYLIGVYGTKKSNFTIVNN